ncbi:hypothetical protein Scep_015379 [Stephania cephalantha]|uniref:HECT-type E3 ubiquitin transferase n=1 Tax=Stephania cephalantha TaxID=152367 RepID=A0AAP0P1B4_9MAGN
MSNQVSLRGASAKEITRDALLEKVSQERELRNYTRRAAASALFIQRVWRRYTVTKKVALQTQKELEATLNDQNVAITNTWVSHSLLRPFLFFATRLSYANLKQKTDNVKCLLACFKIIWKSLNYTESQKNFCSLAVGSSEERKTWHFQTQKLVSLCLLILAECDQNSLEEQDMAVLTSLAMRVVVALTDAKAWKIVNDRDLKDADEAVKNLVKNIASGKSGLYKSIRAYIMKLDYRVISHGNHGLQTGDQFLVVASAITLALRPFQLVDLCNLDSANSHLTDAVEEFCVFLLTVPRLVQRLPTILVPALKHKSVLSPCLRALLISKDNIFTEMSKLDHPKADQIPSSGWALANVVQLATDESLSSGQFSQDLDCPVYVHAVNNVAENVLAWAESVGCTTKNSHSLDNTESTNEVHDTNVWDGKTTFGSLERLNAELWKPVYQQWHLMTLLTVMKKNAFTGCCNTLRNECADHFRDLRLLDIAYLYSYMLRLFSSLNPLGGSLSILNMLSFTPGFLLDMWESLESSIFSRVQDKTFTTGTSSGHIVGSIGKTQRKISKDVGNKWANVLQKITGKLATNIEYEHSVSVDNPSSLDEGNSCDSWDVEHFKHGPQGISKDVSCMMHLFCAIYSHLLLILDDVEFYEKQVPFKLEQQRKIASALNTLVYNGISQISGQQRTPMMDAAVRCLLLLYERDCRHQFCPPDLWLSPGRKSRLPIAAAARAHEAISSNLRSGDSLSTPTMGSVITIIPHVFPFEERVQMFREFIKSDKASRRMAGEVAGPGPGSAEIVVRRGHIVEDGFKQLNNLGSRLKSSIHVSFVSESGLPEVGLDYGGLSKEFLTDISKTAFNPDYGLFSQTATSERLLIPNTSARLLDNGVQMVEFLGRIVGKALYEGILLDYSFSHVFVQKILGRYSFLDDLSMLDPELYRNLMYVKGYDGDVKDLSLDFTVTEELLGKRVTIELKPGGKDTMVTNDNKLQYVHAIADYKLNRQILPFANAFYRGLVDVISPSWLSLFSANEFNQLLSGGKHDIDVGDLKSNTRYTGGYSEGSRTIKIFWEVLTGFEPKERCMLLKFVTSCSRAPLLGFKHLEPAFTIHKVACDVPIWATFGGQDVERLPSASTCYNTLKLPTYKRAATLRAKLLYAISSNAGFELS